MTLAGIKTFPARAGMNRGTIGLYTSGSDVPRTSGDEPIPEYVKLVKERRSPHERG